jgi:hypothetical protein
MKLLTKLLSKPLIIFPLKTSLETALKTTLNITHETALKNH